MIGKICGTGAYVPPNVMDNDDLANLVKTSDEWIKERTGIARRHIAQEENTVSMAVKSAERALENAKISVDYCIDYIFKRNSSLCCLRGTERNRCSQRNLF